MKDLFVQEEIRVNNVLSADLLSFSIKHMCCLPTYRKTNSKLNPDCALFSAVPRVSLWELTEDWILLHFLRSRLLEVSSPSVSGDHVSERLPCLIIDMKVQLNT